MKKAILDFITNLYLLTIAVALSISITVWVFCYFGDIYDMGYRDGLRRGHVTGKYVGIDITRRNARDAGVAGFYKDSSGNLQFTWLTPEGE